MIILLLSAHRSEKRKEKIVSFFCGNEDENDHAHRYIDDFFLKVNVMIFFKIRSQTLDYIDKLTKNFVANSINSSICVSAFTIKQNFLN